MYNSCPNCGKGRLLLDDYFPNKSMERTKLFVGKDGPEHNQIVICNLGHGPWRITRTEEGIGFHKVEAASIPPYPNK